MRTEAKCSICGARKWSLAGLTACPVYWLVGIVVTWTLLHVFWLLASAVVRYSNVAS